MLPAEQIEFNRLLDIVRSTYEHYGFSPIDTPDLELTEVLLAKGGGETEQQVYSFKREGSSTDLTLRYDLTVPLARYAAEHESELIFPFRRSHIGKVHRAERQQKGRFREFYQCDVDAIGTTSPYVDAEIPAVINEVFEKFAFGEFTIRINNRLILNGFFEGIGLKKVSKEVLRTIDKMEKISRDTLVSELKTIGLTDEQVTKVLEFTEISGSVDEMLAQLKALTIDSEDYYEGVEKLSTVIDTLKLMRVPHRRYVIDLRIARGLDYYTGTVYETTLNDYPELGSVCSGGRYDDLASNYTKTSLPGVGMSIGLTRLFSKLKEIPGLLDFTRMSTAETITIPVSAKHMEYAVIVSAAIREVGFPTILHSEDEKLAKKFRYASRMGFKWALIVGDEEVANETVTVKNLQNETSQTVELSDLPEALSLF